jgi:hypothetical protein
MECHQCACDGCARLAARVKVLEAALRGLLSSLDDHSEATPINFFAIDREKASAALAAKEEP